MASRKDELARDPAYGALYRRAIEMARADVAAGRDPQVMTGQFAAVDDDYQEAYLAALLEKQLSSN